MTYATAELITNPCVAGRWSEMWWTWLQATASRVSHLAMCQFVGAVGGRVQRSNPLRWIEREFLFEADMSYVAMGMLAMNSALCELQLRPEKRVRLRGCHTSPLKRQINQEARTSDEPGQMEEAAHYLSTGCKTESNLLTKKKLLLCSCYGAPF